MTSLKTNWFQIRFNRFMVMFLACFLFTTFHFENFATTYYFQNSTQFQNPTRATRTYRVKPGDTKFSLARAFDVSIEQMENENPQIKRQLLAGQVITVSNAKDPATMYVVVAGDTKFSLAKYNGVTVERLEASNPHIKPMLKIGQVLHIPNTNQGNYLTTSVNEVNSLKEDKTEPVNIATHSNSEGYELYTVQPDDTLWGLSQKAGMTVDEFSKLNPHVSENLKAGTTLKMPVNSIKVSPISNSSSSYVNLSRTVNTSKQVELAVIMHGNDDVHANFMRGANLAMDSLRKIGIKATLYTKSISDLTNNSNSFSGIIIPKNPSQEVKTALKSVDKTPIFSWSYIGSDNNNLISVQPLADDSKKGLLNYLKNKNLNVVVVSDPKQMNDIQVIESVITNPNYVQTDDKGIFDKSLLTAALKKDQGNAVIIDSSDPNVFLVVTNLLLTKLNDYQMQLAVLDGSYIPDETLVSTKRYRILKMLYPANTPLIVSNSEAKFLRSYSKRYGTQANEEAIDGFDIIFDTALRLAQNEELTRTFDNSITKQFNLKFQYELGSNGYENHGFYLYQYDPQVGIKEIN
ncbi:LysM peptidoglycan-binding domain-containing protein [Aegicerativicinus sediminis]